MAILDSLNAAKSKITSSIQSSIQERQSVLTNLNIATQAATTPVSETVNQLKQSASQIGENLSQNFDSLSSINKSISDTLSQTNITNLAQSAVQSAQKMAQSVIEGLVPAEIKAGVEKIGNFASGLFKGSLPGIGGRGISKNNLSLDVPPGAESSSRNTKGVKVSFRDITGRERNADTRVKIRVPLEYLTELTKGPSGELLNIGGIVFPYTPAINFEQKAEYQTVTPTHSNFPLNFYQRSSLGNISIAGKFSVQNDKDAGVYLAVLHLLRALTKMRFGDDIGAGSPPPVCRLDAYGYSILNSIPVAISSFRIDLPENVDYYTYGKRNIRDYLTSVPTVSTINITCVPMYSRREMLDFSVTKFLNPSAEMVKKGFV